jgi:hypothetical protein
MGKSLQLLEEVKKLKYKKMLIVDAEHLSGFKELIGYDFYLRYTNREHFFGEIPSIISDFHNYDFDWLILELNAPPQYDCPETWKRIFDTENIILTIQTPFEEEVTVRKC